MAIKKIRVKNFKSFKDLEVELGNLNILIGANASGKSNFADIFRFLRDIEDSGLENAISMQGGVEYLRNINIGSSEVFSSEVIFDQDSGSGTGIEKRPRIHETTYGFAIEFNGGESGFKIVEDKLTHRLEFRLTEQNEETGVAKETVLGEITYSNVEGKVETDPHLPDGIPVKQKKDLLSYLESLEKMVEVSPKALLLENSLVSSFIPFYVYFIPFYVYSLELPTYLLETSFSDISIYDFDPKLPKRFAPITGKVELEGNGENLAIVLKNIIGNEDAKRKLLNLVTYLLDFADDLDVERSADKSFLFKLRETYSKQYLPASLISDGTINMIALIIALYFGKSPLVIVEEPERNIHPHLISKVVRMMEDASRNKQIIVTTHNPEMVKHADPKDILLVSRDKDGFSSISRLSEISDKERVRTFLENEIGIEELYVDNLLGV